MELLLPSLWGAYVLKLLSTFLKEIRLLNGKYDFIQTCGLIPTMKYQRFSQRNGKEEFLRDTAEKILYERITFVISMQWRPWEVGCPWEALLSCLVY